MTWVNSVTSGRHCPSNPGSIQDQDPDVGWVGMLDYTNKAIQIYHLHVFTYNVGKMIINHPPVISIFIAGISTIPSHGWFMALF